MRIDHVAMYVKDLEAAKDFFIRYFNGKSNECYHNEKTGFRSYFITFDDGAKLEIMNRPEIQKFEAGAAFFGYSHIAFRLGSKEMVDTLTAQLKADGYETLSGPRITGDGYYESCIVGIEGNQIELTI